MSVQTLTKQFDGHAVTIVMYKGEPHWVAREVGRQLEYSGDGKSFTNRLRNEWNEELRPGVHIVKLAGEELAALRGLCGRGSSGDPLLDPRLNELVLLTERGLYRVLMLTQKPKARPFRDWVEDVAVEIRQTGQYVAPGAGAAQPSPPPAADMPLGPAADKMQAMLLLGAYHARQPGVKPGIAAAATYEAVRVNLGIDTEPFRRALPASEEPRATLNATALGKLLGLTAKAANMLLVKHGLQLRNERGEWELTAEGERWGESIPFARGGHSGYQILWRREVMDELDAEVAA